MLLRSSWPQLQHDPQITTWPQMIAQTLGICTAFQSIKIIGSDMMTQNIIIDPNGNTDNPDWHGHVGQCGNQTPTYPCVCPDPSNQHGLQWLLKTDIKKDSGCSKAMNPHRACGCSLDQMPSCPLVEAQNTQINMALVVKCPQTTN